MIILGKNKALRADILMLIAAAMSIRISALHA